MKHLTEHQVAGFLDHALPPEERRLVEEHLEACADCRREMVVLSRTLADLPKGRRWWIPAAIAAGVIALLVVPRAWFYSGGPTPSPERTPTVGGERLGTISVVSPADDVTTNAHAVFMWHTVGANEYRVSVLADDGRPIWHNETPDTSLSLPDSVSLIPGHAYFWRVEAIGNGIVATSGVHRLTIRP